MQTLIYSYAKDSCLYERSVATLLTPYILCIFEFCLFLVWFTFHFCFLFFIFFIADGTILSEMFRIREKFVKKEKFRISIGTWNINGDKNPALEDEYPSILDAWILNGPENISIENRNDDIIPTNGIHR